jgi:DNA-binding transcriptional LysR family regulator
MQNPGADDDYRWDDLRTFLALWRSGSLLAAARALQVNPSTVGRRLDALEEALSVQLYERTPEGVIATLAAEQLVPFAEAVERSNQEFSLALRGLEREPEGTVRVTGPPGLVDHFLAPALGELRAQFPRIRVSLDASIGYADLSRGEADIALRAGRPQRGDLVSQMLGPYRSSVVGAAHVYEGGAPIKRLDALPWCQWGDELLHIPDARWVTEHVDDASVVLRTNSFAAQIEAARAGVSVMVTAEPFAALDGLCRVPLAGAAKRALAEMPSQPIFLVGHQALRRVPRVAVVWTFLREKMSNVG